jgi:hypothetical protein
MYRWYNYDPRDGTGLGKREQGNPSPVEHKRSYSNNNNNEITEKPRRRPPADVRITAEGGQYYIFTKDKVYHASLDELGEIVQGDLYLGDTADLELDIYPPVRWGKGYKGTAGTQFPHPNMYSLQDPRIPLDQLTVRDLTHLLSARKRRFPSALEAWHKRLNLRDHEWAEIATRYTTTFLTPRDFHTHFKHIVHRALVTRERGINPACGSMCRLCGRHREISTHVGECGVIRKIFTRINKLECLQERFTYPTSAEGRRGQAKRIPFACPGAGAPKSIINFMIILWKNILISIYKVDIESAPFNSDVIWHYTLKRFADLALAQAHEARTLQLRAINKGEDPPPSLSSKHDSPPSQH